MEQADLFLLWLSERGSGPWDTLRDTARWLFGDALPGDRWWVVADRLADLGHIDLDRDARRWSAAPAVINYLPPRSMQSVLCGSRTLDIDRIIKRLAESSDAPDVAFAEIPQEGGPSVWVFAGTREETAAFAAYAGLPFVDDAADRIANRLGPIVNLLGPGSYVRGGGDPILAFDADDLGYRTARDPGRPGLYKIAGAGGPRFVYSPRPGYFHNVDPRLGTYLELSRQGKSVIRYARGDMWVPRWLPLPDPHRRCLTLCTGFLPGDDGEFLRYEAVPKVIADKIARSLSQRPIGVVPARRSGVEGPR
jgi:hypothetical protein